MNRVMILLNWTLSERVTIVYIAQHSDIKRNISHSAKGKAFGGVEYKQGMEFSV